MKKSLAIVMVLVAMMLQGCGGKPSGKTDAEATDDSEELAQQLPDADEDEQLPKGAEELFDDFIFNFSKNERLQRGRIAFPLKVVSAHKTEELEASQWLMEPFFSDADAYTLIFDDAEQMELVSDTSVSQATVEKIFLDDDSVRQYMFHRKDGRWMLDEVRVQQLKDNPNASFLGFYSRFAGDSLFQQQSLSDEIEFSGPDPDDDFEQIEGFITPGSWAAFAPELPQGVISNIVYGKRKSDSRQKTFLIRGIDSEQEIEMTFSRQKGKWKLTRLTE